MIETDRQIFGIFLPAQALNHCSEIGDHLPALEHTFKYRVEVKPLAEEVCIRTYTDTGLFVRSMRSIDLTSGGSYDKKTR